MSYRECRLAAGAPGVKSSSPCSLGLVCRLLKECDFRVITFESVILLLTRPVIEAFRSSCLRKFRSKHGSGKGAASTTARTRTWTGTRWGLRSYWSGLGGLGRVDIVYFAWSILILRVNWPHLRPIIRLIVGLIIRVEVWTVWSWPPRAAGTRRSVRTRLRSWINIRLHWRYRCWIVVCGRSFLRATLVLVQVSRNSCRLAITGGKRESR